MSNSIVPNKTTGDLVSAEDINNIVSSINSKQDSLTNTDSLNEGSSNKYFTAARVLASILTGFSVSSGGPIITTDSVLQGLGKLQRQLNDLFKIPTGGTTGQVLAKSSNTDGDTHWVDVTGGGSSNTFSDGLTDTAGVVKLGGPSGESISIDLTAPQGLGIDFSINLQNSAGTESTQFDLQTGRMLVQTQDANGNTGGLVVTPGNSSLSSGHSSDNYVADVNLVGNKIQALLTNGNTGGISGLEIDPLHYQGIKVMDDISSVGLFYPSDYSPNYIPRSLVDMAYVDSKTSTTQQTGTNINFDKEYIYGTISSPVTGSSITLDSTNAKLGITNIIIHNSSSGPTFDLNFKKLSGSGDYIINVNNFIYCTYIDDTNVIYSINQLV